MFMIIITVLVLVYKSFCDTVFIVVQIKLVVVEKRLVKRLQRVYEKAWMRKHV